MTGEPMSLEIYKTETWDYKEQPKSRETMFVSLVERLQAPEAA